MPTTLVQQIRNHQRYAAHRGSYRRSFVGGVLLFIIILTSATTWAQHPSNCGTDFYLSLPLLEQASNEYSVQIVATARRGCSFMVSCPGIGWSQSGSVAANGSAAIALPWSQIYDSTCEALISRGIHVTATDSIACYLSVFLTNNWGGSGDITLIPPTDLLGSRYIVQTYPSSSNHYHGSSLVVVATEPNITINIMPHARTSTGHGAGNPINVHLAQAGDTYRLLSVAGSDLSGTSVTASDGKRIALFCGNRYNGVPNSAGSSDMMFSQVPPTNQWGTEFVVPASNHQAYPDRVRITADSNGAQIYINNTLATTLSAYQTYEYTLASPSTDCYIVASQPVLVNLYYPSSVNTYKGDPAQLPIPPIDQVIHHGVTFAQNVNNHVSGGNDPYINQHYLDIITLTDNKANIRVDGNSVASQFHTVSGNTRYSVAHISVNQGTHTINDDIGSGFLASFQGRGHLTSYASNVGYLLASHTYFDTLICDTLLPLTWRDRYYNVPGIDTLYYIDQQSGDSLVIYSLDTICCRPEPTEGRIWVPNIFTPDKSDNSRFRIYCNDIREAEVAIYHRWGLFVTRFDGLTGYWDGTKNGIKVPTGAYVYKITYSTNQYPSETQILIGTVHLIR